MSTPAFPLNLAPQVLSLVRIVSAYLFVLHGTAKHLGMLFIETMAATSPTSLSGLMAFSPASSLMPLRRHSRTRCRKLEPLQPGHKFIRSIYGVGYRFDAA